MNEGVFFYWMLWMGWVFSTFLMPKNKDRTKLSFLFLISIILSGYSVSISIGSINLGFIFCLAIGFIYAVNNHEHLINHLLGSFLVAVSYVSIQLFSLYDPVKLIMDKRYLLISAIVIVMVFILKRQSDMLFIMFIGLFIGDCLYQMLIYRLQGFIEIGSKFMLDLAVLTSLPILAIHSGMEILSRIKKATNKKVNSANQI